jgi:hypothetical protein
MTRRNTIIRSLHDVGAAAWFGGSLMGATGVNGAAAAVRDPHDRTRVASAGWKAWQPVSAAAIGAHVVGGAGILYANRDRAKHQSGVRANTVIKLAVTGAALAVTVANAALGRKAAEATGRPVEGATEPAPGTPEGAAAAQQQLRYLQWAQPLLTGAIVVLGAQQGEQQRPGEIAAGVGSHLLSRVRD